MPAVSDTCQSISFNPLSFKYALALEKHLCR